MIDVKRSAVPPNSLQRQSSFNDMDVREQLHADFLGKCYLTEQPLTIASVSVDHFHPKGDPRFEHMTFDWQNLFPASRDANERRPKKWPEGGLLDPSADDCVEERLVQWLDDNMQPRFTALDANDQRAINTAEQLDHIHNANGSPKAADLRSAIARYYCLVQEKLHTLRNAVEELPQNKTKIARLEAEVKDMLSRRSPFTALIRSRVLPIWPYDHYFD